MGQSDYWKCYADCVEECEEYNSKVEAGEHSDKLSHVRNWVATVFEFNEETITKDFIKNFPKLKYGVINFEKCPDTDRKHLQCYFEFNASVRYSHIQKYFNTKKLHLEPRYGSAKQASEYCKKEKSRYRDYIEYGTISKDRMAVASGKHMIQWIKDNSETCTYNDFIIEFESDFIRYSNNMDKLWNRFKFQPKTFKHDKLRPIQEDMLKLMEGQNDREIPWIYDECGNIGKSTLADYLCDRGDVFWCSTGGYKDTFHAFSKNPKPYVVMDITRQEGTDTDKMKHLYGILEAFKTGRAFSGKYDSDSLVFTPAKVLVLSNTTPNLSVWSKDRYTSIMSVSHREGNTKPSLHQFNGTKKIDIENQCVIDLDLDTDSDSE